MKYIYIFIILVIIIVVIYNLNSSKIQSSENSSTQSSENSSTQSSQNSSTQSSTQLSQNSPTQSPTQSPKKSIHALQIREGLYLTPEALRSVVKPFPNVTTSVTVSTKALSNMLIVQDVDYKKQIKCGSKITAFCGPRVCLIIDENDWLTETKLPVSLLWNTQENLEIMGVAIQGLENLISAFDNIVGRIPATVSPYYNRPIRLECAYLGGAAGLAGHGTYGSANGPAFIVQYINSITSPIDYHTYQDSQNWQRDNLVTLPIYYQHVTGYEICRNYIFPDQFTPVFQYGVSSDARNSDNTIGNVPAENIIVNKSNYGWPNQGFVNITGLLLILDMKPDVGFNYNGWSYQWFMNYMIGHLNKYITGNKSWQNTFFYKFLEWSPTNSLDNVYSGLIAILWGSYGRTAFLKNWFACLSKLPVTNSNYVIAADNFFIASCYGAQLNLSNYFINTLRWPITPETLTNVKTLFGEPTTNMPTYSVPTNSIVKL
jgi:hypothetical protein